MNTTTATPEPEYVPSEFKIGFVYSLIESFILTLVAEFGDKSFIMLIILQYKTNKATVLISSLLTILLMNICANFIGLSIDYLLYKNLIDYVGITCFLIYGLWLIGEAFHTKDVSFEAELNYLSKQKEERKKAKQIQAKKSIVPLSTILENPREEAKADESNAISPVIHEEDCYRLINDKPESDTDEEEEEKDQKVDPKMFWAIASSVAISECGDRTQLTGLTLAAIYDFKGIILGSCCALIVTTSSGVFLGKYMIKYLNEKFINAILGAIFVVYSFQIYFGKN